MKILKPLMLLLLAIVLSTIAYLLFQHEIQASHDTPYTRADVDQVEAPKGEPSWRLLLLGDAGDSTLNPWHPTLVLASKLASIKPENTSVVMLGDNIYMTGFPNLDEGETKFDEKQLAAIDRLNAQLQISKRSGAELFLVPGNHDWYASQVDSQAEHVAQYAQQQQANVQFLPWQKGAAPRPTAVHRDGVSLVFLDTQWMIGAAPIDFKQALAQLTKLLSDTAQQHPDNTIVVTGHHPLQTMGPHAEYYTSRGYAFVMGLISLFVAVDQDITNPPYQRLIEGLNTALSSNSKVVYAAGHEHSLQLFEGLSNGPNYQIVSGAANDSKVSGVGHNEHSLFAVSQEGLTQLSLYPEGLLLEAIATSSEQVLHRQWLWRSAP
jgi:hypothetical protein